MTEEFIDSTEDLITKERLAKGDLEVAVNLRGKISRAIPANLTIIKELIRKRVFPYHYEIYGVGFLELRNAFRAPWASRSSAVLLEQWGFGVSNSRADSIYQSVCRQVGVEKMRVVEFVIESPKEKDDVEKHDEYKNCFDKLVEAMDEERERVSLEREKNQL